MRPLINDDTVKELIALLKAAPQPLSENLENLKYKLDRHLDNLEIEEIRAEVIRQRIAAQREEAAKSLNDALGLKQSTDE